MFSRLKLSLQEKFYILAIKIFPRTSAFSFNNFVLYVYSAHKQYDYKNFE